MIMAHLLQQFQDLCHYNIELMKSNEDDVFKLLELMEYLRGKWSTAENELVGQGRIMKTYEMDLIEARAENKDLRGQLVEARSQIAGLAATREDLEKQKSILESQVDMVRNLLRDDERLRFLNVDPVAMLTRCQASRLSSLDIDYDKTEDDSTYNIAVDLDRNHAKESIGGCSKRSISLTHLVPTAPLLDDIVDPTPRKRSKDDMEIPTPDGHLPVGAAGLIENGYRSPLNRSFSEPHNVGGILQPAGAHSMKSLANLAALSPMTAAATGRRHTFLSKPCLKVEYCDPCQHRIAFAAKIMRCEVCGLKCHEQCQEFALLPCIAPGIPASKNATGKLLDYVPRDPPMVPNIVVHCVNEIESRGLTSIGLYRVPGSEAQVMELFNKFLHGRGVPNLRSVLDVNVLSSCIKKFLGQLKDPVVPETSLNDAINAATVYIEHGDNQPLRNVISDMPQPNRDTLAFLMIHLHKVAEFSNENKMTAQNLVKIFTPTIVARIPNDFQTAALQLPKFEVVLKSLFELSPEYWGHFLSQSECPPLFGNTPAVEIKAASRTGTLGPIGGRNAGTPRSAPYKIRGNQKKFFHTPWK